jgi:hypothetical protein
VVDMSGGPNNHMLHIVTRNTGTLIINRFQPLSVFRNLYSAFCIVKNAGIINSESIKGQECSITYRISCRRSSGI